MASTQIPLIASPLYILRDQAAQDLNAVLAKLAELGFDGVELLGFFGHTPAGIRRTLDGLGLKALGNHVPWAELSARPEAVLADHQALGCGFLTVAGLSALDALPLEALACVAALAARAGIRLLFHNHAEELQRKAAGRAQLEELMDAIPADVCALEPDIGWMQIGGGDPAYYLRKYADRCPVIHLKDFYLADGAGFSGVPHSPEGVLLKGGPAEGWFEFRPCGYGISNTAALLPLALACRPQWLVADHDCAYDRNPYDDLALSLTYIKTMLALQN